MYHPFSVTDTVKTSWDILKKNFITIIVYSVVAVIVIFVVGFFDEFINVHQNFVLSVVVFFIIMIIQGYSTLGLYKLIFTLADSEFYEFEFSQIVPSLGMVWSFITISLLFSFFITTYVFFVDGFLKNYQVIETVAQIVGIAVLLFLALRCMFCICFIVDDDSGAIESLKQSFALTKGNFFNILLILVINILLIFIPIAAAYLLNFGWLTLLMIITYPFVNIVLAETYRKLIYSHEDVDDNIAETN